MPRVRSPVCILGIGFLLFAQAHYISRCHLCPDFIDLSGHFSFSSPEVDDAYVGRCFATDYCAMIHFFGAICDRFSLVSTSS